MPRTIWQHDGDGPADAVARRFAASYFGEPLEAGELAEDIEGLWDFTVNGVPYTLLHFGGIWYVGIHERVA